MPRFPVVFHPDAVEEAAAARLWYAERRQSAADSFLANNVGASLVSCICVSGLSLTALAGITNLKSE